VAIKHIPPGGDFFDDAYGSDHRAFGFSGSAVQKPHSGEGTYLGRGQARKRMATGGVALNPISAVDAANAVAPVKYSGLTSAYAPTAAESATAATAAALAGNTAWTGTRAPTTWAENGGGNAGNGGVNTGGSGSLGNLGFGGFSSTGASIGAGLGSLAGGPIGGLVGLGLGGLLGGLTGFGDSSTPGDPSAASQGLNADPGSAQNNMGGGQMGAGSAAEISGNAGGGAEVGADSASGSGAASGENNGEGSGNGSDAGWARGGRVLRRRGLAFGGAASGRPGAASDPTVSMPADRAIQAFGAAAQAGKVAGARQAVGALVGVGARMRAAQQQRGS
jgi:hypothetical protein